MMNAHTKTHLGLPMILGAALSWPGTAARATGAGFFGGIRRLSPPAGIRAQTGSARAWLETGFGLHTATFETSGGKVTVRIPDDLRAGDAISGSITVVGAEKAISDQSRSEVGLGVLELAGQQTPVSSRIAKWLVPAASQGPLTLILKNRNGSELGRVQIPIRLAGDQAKGGERENDPLAYKNTRELSAGRRLEVTRFGDKEPDTEGAKSAVISRVASPAPNPTAILYHVSLFAQAGRPITIQGPFDGDLESTRVRLANQAVNLIAESPRKVVIEALRNLIGPVDILVEKEGNTVAECACRSIGVRLSVAKRSLNRGETTPINVTIAGLEGVDAGFTVRLTSRTPATIEMEGGDSQRFAIDPRQIREGSYTTTRLLTGIQPGDFEVGAVIESGPIAACRRAKGSDAFAASGPPAGAGSDSVSTTDQGGLKVTDKPAAAGSLTLTDQGGLKLTDRPATTVVPAGPTVQPASVATVVPAGPTVQPARTATIQPAPPNRGPNLSNSAWPSHDPEIASSGDNVCVTWVLDMPGNAEVFVAVSTDRGVSFGPAVNLSLSPGQSLNPKIAAAGDS